MKILIRWRRGYTYNFNFTVHFLTFSSFFIWSQKSDWGRQFHNNSLIMKILTKFLPQQKGGLPSPSTLMLRACCFEIFSAFWGPFCQNFQHDVSFSFSLEFYIEYILPDCCFSGICKAASVSILSLISPCALFPSLSLFLFKSYSITFLIFFATCNEILFFFVLCFPFSSCFDSMVMTSLTLVVLLYLQTLCRLSMPFKVIIMIITSLFRVLLFLYMLYDNVLLFITILLSPLFPPNKTKYTQNIFSFPTSPLSHPDLFFLRIFDKRRFSASFYSE